MATSDIHFNINFSHFNSFSEVGIELLKALDYLGITASVEKSDIGSHFTVEEAELLKKSMHCEKSKLFHLKWSHYWDDCFSRKLLGKINLELFAINYEFSRNHQPWDFWMHDAINGSSHKLAISSYCKDVLVSLGCPHSNVSVLPLGFNPCFDQLPFSNQSSTGVNELDSTEIILTLTNSADLFRYGTDVLLKAYVEEFSENENVELWIKDYNPCNTLIQDWLNSLKKDLSKEKLRVKILNKFLTKEELASLYLSVNAFVAPFRGEGFAIKVLDAFRAGLPVAIPLYSGPTEYSNVTNCYPVSYNLSPIRECFDSINHELPNFPVWAEPDLQSLRRSLRHIITDSNRPIVGRAAQSCASNFSWHHSAKKLIDIMADLKNREESLSIFLNQSQGHVKVKLSVVMPTYNRSSILRKTLEAYRNQIGVNFSDVELVIVDDGSSDNTQCIIEDFINSDPPFVVKNFHQKNSGPGAARNLAISHSSGDIIVIVGDDMIPNQIFLKEHLEFHARYPQNNEVMLGFVDWHPEVQINYLMEYITNVGGEQFSYFAIPNKNDVPFQYFYTCNVSLKSRFLGQLPYIFDTDFIYAAFEDTDIAIRLKEIGMRIRYNPLATVFHHHEMRLEDFFKRQYKAGQMAQILLRKHPNKKDILSNLTIKNQDDFNLDNEDLKNCLKIVSALEEIYLEIILLLNSPSYGENLLEKIITILNSLYKDILEYAMILGYNNLPLPDLHFDSSLDQYFFNSINLNDLYSHPFSYHSFDKTSNYTMGVEMHSQHSLTYLIISKFRKAHNLYKRLGLVSFTNHCIKKSFKTIKVVKKLIRGN